MINFRKISNNIQELRINDKEKIDLKLSWYNIITPGKKEIEFLRKKFNFKMEHLTASSSKAVSQRSKIIIEDDYIFLTIHFPTFSNEIIYAGEINFFFGHGFLISLHNNIKPLSHVFNSGRKDLSALLPPKEKSSIILLYKILNQLIYECYEFLDKNSIMLDEIEDIIFENKQKQATKNILFLRRNIINLRKIMQSHKNIFKKILLLKSSIIPQSALKKHFHDLIEKSKQIWEILENQKEMIEALHDTNESLLNYKISDIMKTLTIFSVIVFPLTLLAAIFGLNTINGMPFMEKENGFWFIVLIMLFGSLLMLIFFKKKKWL